MGNNNYSLGIQISDIIVAIRCNDEIVSNWLNSKYSEFLCNDIADLYVELIAIETMSISEVEQRVKDTAVIQDDGIISVGPDLLSIDDDLPKNLIVITFEKNLLFTTFATSYFNQLMGVLFYTGRRERDVHDLDSHFVHSSCIAINGNGIIFTGPSGVGKTTAARMCRDYNDAAVINDEGNMITSTVYGSTIVKGIPIIGKLDENHASEVPLTVIMFLKQSQRTELRSIPRKEAVKRLMYQVFGNRYLGQTNVLDIFSSKIGFSELVTRNIPCYELEFTLDGEELANCINRYLEERSVCQAS